MKKLSKDQIQEIITSYQEGMSPKEIGEKLGIYNNSVTRILKKNGIERNQAAPKITPEQTQFIIEQYQLGVNSEELGRQLNIDSCTVLRILKRNNITIKSNSQSKRKFELDESILDNIDSEEKAYFLGLMWSDGNISKKNNDISIRLLAKDAEILYQLSNYFYGQDRVSIDKNKKNQEIATFRLCSKRLKERLIELGCHPNKTFINKYPENLDPSLDRHFIRGVIDGDGSVLNYDSPIIYIIGTDELTFKISEIIEKNLNIKPLFSKKQKYRLKDVNISSIAYRGFIKANTLAKWIYEGSSIKLNRKYQNYILFKNNQSEKYFSEEDEQNIINKFISGKSFSEISAEHQEYYSNIKKITQRNVPYNYGSTDVINFNGKLLTKNYIESLNIDEKNIVKKYLLHYFRGFGFPYPKYSDFELLDDWDNIKNFDSSPIINNDKLNTKNYIGNKLTKHFFDNFYSVSFGKNKSMLDAFNDDYLLNKVLDNRLGISYKEHFNISGAMIRQGLRNSNIAKPASTFLATVAKYIYDTYSEKDGIVYDYSAGFGQRLLGAMACKNNLQYIGTEPWSESFKNLNKLSKFIFKQDRCKIYNIGSENFYQEELKEKVCLAFSSPPYFNTEIYCQEETQCNLKSYEDYLNYWEKTCDNIFKMLKINGNFIVNISEKYKDDLIKIASKYFVYDHMLYLSYETDKNEPIIIMKKK